MERREKGGLRNGKGEKGGMRNGKGGKGGGCAEGWKGGKGGEKGEKGRGVRDGEGPYPLLFYGGAVGAEDQFLRGAGEVGEAGNGEVFVVKIRVFAEDLVGLWECH